MVGGDRERETGERTVGGGVEGRQENEEEEEVMQVVRIDGQEKGLTEIPDRAEKDTYLFTCSYDFLQVIFRGESLHRC